MLKKMALLLALSSLTAVSSFGTTTTNDSLTNKAVNAASDMKDKVVDKAAELKDQAVNKMNDMTGKALVVEAVSPWARPSNASTSAVYMNLNNHTAKDVSLTHVTAFEVANKVAIHQTATDSNGLVKMVAVDKLMLPAGKTVELRPNGIHIMLMDLKKPLKVGDTFKLTLKFDDSSTSVVDVEVKDSMM